MDLSEFRSVMRTDGTVTQPRLKQVVLTAISEVNAELYDFRNRQQLLGYRALAEVPADMLDGKSERIQHYHNAVFCWARAVLNERYQDYDEMCIRDRCSDEEKRLAIQWVSELTDELMEKIRNHEYSRAMGVSS